MFLQRYYVDCLAHASYMIADEPTMSAAVIDPQHDVSVYLKEAEERGYSIKHVILTHLRAGTALGHHELRKATGAKVYQGKCAPAQLHTLPVKTGDSIPLGEVRLQILETPGHRPEGISVLVYYELARNPAQPYAVMTGDTLLLGDVGRPSVLPPHDVPPEELADMLYDSLHERLLKLPDETLIYPAHGAISLCGGKGGEPTATTIGVQRRYNHALQPMSPATFRQLVLKDQPALADYPGHGSGNGSASHRSGETTEHETPVPLTVDLVTQLAGLGAQVIDTRDPADFAGAHFRGSVNIGLGSKFGVWCRTILDREKPVIVITEPGEEQLALRRLIEIGMDEVTGYLEGGVAALADRPELIGKLKRITARSLAEQLESAEPPLVIDVRAVAEWSRGNIPRSINIPVDELSRRLETVPRDRQIVLACKGGYRSSLAASLILRSGRRNVMDLVGGYDAWTASGYGYGQPSPESAAS